MRWSWLRKLSWPALKHQVGRQLLALIAITLGVALAYAVHLLNTTALAEFGSAAAAVNGRPDLVLRSRSGSLSDEQYGAVAALPGLAIAAPVIEGAAQAMDAQGQRFNLRVIGIDALQSGLLSPELLPRARPDLQALLDPRRATLNEAAARRLPKGATLLLRAASADGSSVQSQSFQISAQHNAAPGGPLVVLDIAGAQALLGRLGQIDRIDLRMETGGAGEQLKLPEGLTAAPPPDEGARLQDLTRAYRVNLGMLSLMALFTGSFLVFAVLSLSIAQRLPQLALLGVLGMTARERASLVMSEGLLLGLIGSALGLLVGWLMAGLGLRLLGADLGLPMASGMKPALHFTAEQLPAALLFGALGLLVSVAAAALPALAVRRMPVAQVLKGQGSDAQPQLPNWAGPLLMLAGLSLALLPPWGEVPLAAYAGMLALLLGGIACVPLLLRAAVASLAWLPPSPTRLLLRERARDQAGEARRALAGVLVALSLSVAMLVMVGSFRDSLQAWLTQMLPADLYLRSALRLGPGQMAPLPPAYVEALGRSGLAHKVVPQRSGTVALDGQSLALLAREVDEPGLPVTVPLAEGEPGRVPAYINEALRDALRLRPGQSIELHLQADKPPLAAFVRATWRDYARQSPALMLPLNDYQRWSGDKRVTELYVWLAPGANSDQLKALAAEPQDIESASSSELRGLSLRIFDRSFAVTHGLQAVALAIGLFGIAASQSAQVLARRREFGLLLHLGLTRAGVLKLLGAEAALLSGVGALAGLGLGLLLSAVLVYVVNPQSFHWSMDMSLPHARLAALLILMFGAGVLAALLAGRKAARLDAVQAVKEDW